MSYFVIKFVTQTLSKQNEIVGEKPIVIKLRVTSLFGETYYQGVSTKRYLENMPPKTIFPLIWNNLCENLSRSWSLKEMGYALQMSIYDKRVARYLPIYFLRCSKFVFELSIF